MKKLISVVLAVALMASCLLSVPLISQAEVQTETITQTVFDSIRFNSANSSLSAPVFWMDLDAAASKDTTAGFRYKYNSDLTDAAPNGANAMYNGAATLKPILGAANSKDGGNRDTNVGDFTWSFVYTPPKADPTTTYTYFMFHVDKDREGTPSVYGKDMFDYNGGASAAGLDDMSGFFAVVLKGTGADSTDGLKSWSYNVIQPTKVGDKWVMRPVEYTEQGGVVTSTSAVNLESASSVYGRGLAITIELKGNKLTLKSNYIGSWSTVTEKTFTLSDEALAAAPSGDFAYGCSAVSVKNGGSGFDREKHLHNFSNVSISRYVDIQRDPDIKKNVLFTSVNSNTGAALSTQWMGTDDKASSLTYAGNASGGYNFLTYSGNKNFLSTPILAHNTDKGYESVVQTYTEDFEWSFTEVGKSTTWRRPDTLIGYFFHVNDNSMVDAIYDYNYYDGTTAGLKDLRNCFAVVYSYEDTTDGLKGRAFTVLQPAYDEQGNPLGLRPISYTLKGSNIIPDESAYLYVDDTGLRQEWAKDITLRLEGNLLTVKYDGAQDGKTGEKFFFLSEDELAKNPSGDFVIHHNRDWDHGDDGALSDTEREDSVYVCGYADMTISELYSGGNTENGAADATHTPIGQSPIRLEKASCSTGGLVTLMGQRAVFSAMVWNDSTQKYGSAFVATKGITGKALTDYTLKYNYIVAGTAWTLDALSLRIQDSDNPDRIKGYSLVIQGTSFPVDGEKPAGSVITIQKDRQDSVSTKNIDRTKMSMVVLDTPLTVGAEYTVEVEVKGGAVSAWIYEAAASRPAQPTISYTDPEAKYTSGDIAFVARDEGYSVTDITVKDSVLGTICENWNPEIYNNSVTLNASDLFSAPYNTGVVSLTGDGYNIVSGNTVTTDTYSVETNGFVASKDLYLQNFELCYEVSFNGLKNNTASVHFSARDYTDQDYELRLNGSGTATLFKGGKELKTVNVKFMNQVKYQVVVNVNGGKINVYVYLLTGDKPTAPTLAYNDKSPLPAGYITFGTENGDFNLSAIAVKAFDKVTVKGPTGTIFQKNFEGNDFNLDGLELSLLNTDKTVLKTDKKGNSFLRIVGTRNADPKDYSGVDALSRVKFGSEELYNYDLTASIRFKAAFSASWSYLAVASHANPAALGNQAIWLDVGAKGSAAVKIDSAQGLTNNNIVATTGVITGTQQTAFVPNDTQVNGLPVDGRWHQIKVSVRENTYTLYLDDKKVLSYTDPDNTYEKGAVYLYGYGLNYDLDNIKLTNNSTSGEVKASAKTLYEKSEVTLAKGQKLQKLTGKNVSQFEWQFSYKADSAADARTVFLFRTNSDSKLTAAVNGYTDMENVFGFTIAGDGDGKQVSGIINKAINVFAPNPDPASSGNILPPLYTQEKDDKGNATGPIVPDATTAASLDYLRYNNGDIKAPFITTGEWMTVKVRLVGNKLHIVVWQTENKAKTIRSSVFTLSSTTLDNITAGDFAVLNGNTPVTLKDVSLRDISGTYKAGN